LPVLIVTAYDSYVDDPRVSEADGYVIKNFAVLDELKKRVKHLLDCKAPSEIGKNQDAPQSFSKCL
jgi:hypothetical protein